MNHFQSDQVNENSLTNHDAVLCKVSADQCGLLPDKFIAEFVNHPHHHGHPRRHIKPPIINRGTFLRTVSIDSVVRSFITENHKNSRDYQIISLGSGFDTRLFRFMDEFKPEELDNLKYFEVDFEQVVEEKKRIVEKTPILKELADPWNPVSFDLNGDIIGGFSKALGTKFNPNSPTLIVAECCLMYLTAESGDDLIKWAASTLRSSVTFCSFDPILSDDLDSDRFAKTMLDNFEQRGLDTHGLLKYPSIQSSERRFGLHFPSVKTFTMLQLERDNAAEFLVSLQERRLMMMKTALDEYEEWNLLASHYLLTIATSETL